MQVNWFEGGRRITKLCMAIAALIGAYNAFFEYNPPTLEFSAGSPRDAWHPTLMSRDAPDWAKAPLVCAREEFLSDMEIKPGLVRDVSLCFLPNEAGDINYYSLSEENRELDGEIAYLQKVEAAINRAKAAGQLYDAKELKAEANRLQQNINRAKSKLSGIIVSGPDGNKYVFPEGTADAVIFAALRKRFPALDREEAEAELSQYIAQRVADFSITPAALASIEKELPRIEREAFIDHVKEVLSIAAYFVGGFWLFSFVIGWIVRGFAGIPRGQDFRPSLEPDATG